MPGDFHEIASRHRLLWIEHHGPVPIVFLNDLGTDGVFADVVVGVVIFGSLQQISALGFKGRGQIELPNGQVGSPLSSFVLVRVAIVVILHPIVARASSGVGGRSGCRTGKDPVVQLSRLAQFLIVPTEQVVGCDHGGPGGLVLGVRGRLFVSLFAFRVGFPVGFVLVGRVLPPAGGSHPAAIPVKVFALEVLSPELLVAEFQGYLFVVGLVDGRIHDEYLPHFFHPQGDAARQNLQVGLQQGRRSGPGDPGNPCVFFLQQGSVCRPKVFLADRLGFFHQVFVLGAQRGVGGQQTGPRDGHGGRVEFSVRSGRGVSGCQQRGICVVVAVAVASGSISIRIREQRRSVPFSFGSAVGRFGGRLEGLHKRCVLGMKYL
mmetsp:Transcript_25457/g.55762  ORF Transcript_25457/g.55762 Transcript_25457/m.55762 type:complete len:376 (-) Transcript_25457:733-1860(-)